MNIKKNYILKLDSIPYHFTIEILLTNIISLIQKIWIKYNNLEYFDERTSDISESGRIPK